MKLFKNLAALCLAALMVLGVGGSFLPEALGTVVTAEAESRTETDDSFFSISYRSDSDKYDGPDIDSEKWYYEEDEQPVEVKDVDEVFDEDDYEGWTFLYWKYEGKTVKPGAEVDDAGEGDIVKLYAVWEEGDNGGDGDFEITYKIGEAGDADDVVKYVDGDFTALKVSKVFDEDDYAGWDFDCWKITKGDDDYKGEYYDAGDTIPEEAFNSDDELVLLAQWDESDSCVVKYASGNSKATGTTPTTQTVDYGDSITLPSNPYTLSGYTFAGWDVDGTVKKAGDKVTIKKSMTITATWTAVANVTLTYSPGKGAGTAYTKTYAAGTTIKLEANSFTRDGYTFAGWW
ncbi:MAG TPA: InlB B-repeat-containing protein, partial [Oscillospiraceae bacterium]|nr:InlB B-repeat-containing protein [Oscillospiraceae bacterium]